MESNRKKWNERHKKLRHALEKSIDREKALELFLIQHAMVHTARLSRSSLFSFEDEILKDLGPESFKQIPHDGNHSIAWIIWHLARVEDVTMNILMADVPQLLIRDGWLKRLKINAPHTGNGMSDKEVRDLSGEMDIRALRDYRLAVGRETRKTVRQLKATDFRQKVDPARIQRIWDEHAMLPNAQGIVDYWAKRTISGLLLMPPTRHCFLHLNEARRIKLKVCEL